MWILSSLYKKQKKFSSFFDFKKIEELTGEIEELNIKSSDIKKLIDIISFIEMLKGKTSKKDKDFFIIFIIDVLSKDNNNLFLSLNDVSLKFKHIEELITKTLDISGYATIIHNVIFSKSIILISL